MLKCLDSVFRSRRSCFQESSLRAICCLLKDYKLDKLSTTCVLGNNLLLLTLVLLLLLVLLSPLLPLPLLLPLNTIFSAQERPSMDLLPTARELPLPRGRGFRVWSFGALVSAGRSWMRCWETRA